MTKQASDPVQLDHEHLHTLLEVGRTFNSSLEMDQVLNLVMDKIIEVIKAERGYLMLVDRDTGELKVRVARNMDHATIESDDFKISRNIVRKVLEDKIPVRSSNAMEDSRLKEFGSVTLHGIRSILCVPLIRRDKVIGVIYVDNRIHIGIFKPIDLEMLLAISYHASTAIDNARLYANSRNTITALANAIEARDSYTKGHVERVARLAVLMATAIELPEDDVKEIETASILHDVGKIGVKDQVLSKPGKLTDAERKDMEKHPGMGGEIVGPINFSRQVKDGIRHHQERYDGKGYPDQLKGDAIPLFARILAVADTYDAMTSNRPYRNALPEETAIEEIKRNAGIQFDPAIVKVFLQVITKLED